MPAIREIADPLRRDEALGEVRRVSGVEERVLRQVLERPARNPIGDGRSAGRPRWRVADHRRRGPVLARRAADPRHPARDHAGRVGAAPAPPARPRPAAPGRRRARAGPAAEHRRPRAVPGDRPPARARTTRASTRRSTAPRCCSRSTTKRRRSLGRCMQSRVRTRARSTRRSSTTRSTRLLLELEDDQLRDRSDYNEAAQAEAERAGDREAIDRLMLERRQINETRLSLDRRRDQTRLLASHRR